METMTSCLLFSVEVFQSLVQVPRRPRTSSGLQDPSDPASVPRISLAPLKHEATRLRRIYLQRGFMAPVPDLGGGTLLSCSSFGY